jgi:hypothetical protein
MALAVERLVEAVVPEAEVGDYLLGQKETAREVLQTLGSLTIAQRRLETTYAAPDAFSQDYVDSARGMAQDLGTVWRRASDGVSAGIAAAFPEQVLEHPILGPGLSHTDRHKLFKSRGQGEAAELIAFYGLTTHDEMLQGIRIASQNEWGLLLYAMALGKPVY